MSNRDRRDHDRNSHDHEARPCGCGGVGRCGQSPARGAKPGAGVTSASESAGQVHSSGTLGGASQTNPWDGGVVDRRVMSNRRGAAGEVGGGVTGETGLERRRSAGRRLSDFQKSAEEGEMTKEQFMFLMAINAFKRGNALQFPTWTDVLEVIRLMGYRKTLASELNLASAEDWTESADAPANVRAARWHERALVDKARREKPAA